MFMRLRQSAIKDTRNVKTKNIPKKSLEKESSHFPRPSSAHIVGAAIEFTTRFLSAEKYNQLQKILTYY